ELRQEVRVVDRAAPGAGWCGRRGSARNVDRGDRRALTVLAHSRTGAVVGAVAQLAQTDDVVPAGRGQPAPKDVRMLLSRRPRRCYRQLQRQQCYDRPYVRHDSPLFHTETRRRGEFAVALPPW